jgi:hypothetical protein
MKASAALQCATPRYLADMLAPLRAFLYCSYVAQTHDQRGAWLQVQIVTEMRAVLQSAENARTFNINEVFSLFTQRAYDNLHVCTCIDAQSNELQQISSKFPGLVTRAQIDWYLDWPADTMHDIAEYILDGSELNLDEAQEEQDEEGFDLWREKKALEKKAMQEKREAKEEGEDKRESGGQDVQHGAAADAAAKNEEDDEDGELDQLQRERTKVQVRAMHIRIKCSLARHGSGIVYCMK